MFQLSWGKLRREPATRWFDRSFAPIPSSDDRFARQNRYGPPPEFPLASSWPGIDHHLSGTRRCAQRTRSSSRPACRRPSQTQPSRNPIETTRDAASTTDDQTQQPTPESVNRRERPRRRRQRREEVTVRPTSREYADDEQSLNDRE